MIPTNNKKYANEHPKGKKPTEDGSIKIAKSKQMKLREFKLMQDFDEALENYMIKFRECPKNMICAVFRTFSSDFVGKFMNSS